MAKQAHISWCPNSKMLHTYVYDATITLGQACSCSWYIRRSPHVFSKFQVCTFSAVLGAMIYVCVDAYCLLALDQEEF